MKIIEKEKMLIGTFLLMWQGQFVSGLGSAVYSIAMGFWIFNVTGSTAIMGSMMAGIALPGILLGPFAGVIVDRCNKKNLMILMDVFRGLCVIFIAVAANKGLLTIWMVFIASILLSLGGVFYRPAVKAVIPDIVPKSRLTNANAIFGTIFSASELIGNTLGGYLYQMVGGPMIFLINGLSFLFSGTALLPAKIPAHKNRKLEQHYFADLKNGFRYVWKYRGLRFMIVTEALQSFFFNIAIILFLPVFNQTPDLGPTRYGIAMAAYAIGMLSGMAVTSVIRIPPEKRMLVFMAATLSYCLLLFSCIFLIGNFTLMCLMLLLGGLCDSVWDVICNSSVQAVVSRDMRGKVFSLMSTVTQGLVPIAMAVGGVLGEFFSYTAVIGASFLINFFLFMPFAFNRNFIQFINYDANEKVAEEV